MFPFPQEASPLETRKVSLQRGRPWGKDVGGPSPTCHLAPLPLPHMGWGVGRGSKQPNPPKQKLISMVTRVPGGWGCSRSSCPPEHPIQAPEPQLMPTQHPVSPICLLWGPAGAAMSTPFIVPRVCLPPGYCQGRVGSSKQKSQVRVHLHLYSHASTLRSLISTLCSLSQLTPHGS